MEETPEVISETATETQSSRQLLKGLSVIATTLLLAMLAAYRTRGNRMTTSGEDEPSSSTNADWAPDSQADQSIAT